MPTTRRRALCATFAPATGTSRAGRTSLFDAGEIGLYTQSSVGRHLLSRLGDSTRTGRPRASRIASRGEGKGELELSELGDLWFDPKEYADQLGYTDELGRGDHSDPTLVRAETPEARRRGMTRRELLVKGGVGAAALATAGGMAGSAAAKPGRTGKSGAYTGTLNVISLGVEWPAGAQDQAQKDLGVKFNVQLLSTNAQVQKSITAPSSFDIGGLYNYQMFPIWPTGNFQTVDRTKVTAWNDLYPVFTKGRV